MKTYEETFWHGGNGVSLTVRRYDRDGSWEIVSAKVDVREVFPTVEAAIRREQEIYEALGGAL